MIWWRLPVAFAWFTIALCILLALTEVIHFTYHSSSGIYGWIAATQYPKQQELFWFLAAVAGIPFLMLCGWALWITGAALGARLGQQPPERILKCFALCHLPVMIVWPRLSLLHRIRPILRADSKAAQLRTAMLRIIIKGPNARLKRSDRKSTMPFVTGNTR